ncbi:hypothetical protein KP509_01G017800 [Ceratopteris richardii]|nr:hypothetical protein KP509_01G017800 [Ceratopteris richardii]KAH7445614.1 hypothetical protein KP509_01G017800 [Ceratopteris richardii]
MDCCATGSNDSPSKDGNQNNVGDLQSNALFYQLSSEVSKMRNDIDLLKKKVDEIEDLKSEIKQIKSMVNFQEVRSGASEKSSSTETNKFRQTLDSKTTNAPEKVGFSVKNVFSKHNLLKSSNENAGKKHFKEHSTSGNNRESPAEDQPMTRYPNNVDADFYSTEGTPSASFTSWRPSLHKSSNEDTRKKHSMPGDHREPPAEDPSIIHYPNIIDTGLYSTEATPSALSTSVDNVKNRLYRYAKEVQIFGIRRKLKLDYSTVGNEGISNYLMRYSGPKTLLLGKCVIEALVSEQIFQNFELRSFGGITQGLFQKPDDFKMLRLHIYKNYKEEEPKTMYDQIPAFKDFVNRKLLEVRNLITCRLFTESNEIEDGEREHLFDERFEPFLKLSKEVWLLHTLAFGCQPASAEIFRVPAGSSYMAQYMKEKEDIRGPLDSRQAANRKVACMTVPGFTLRSSIIPADVCCYDSLTSGL